MFKTLKKITLFIYITILSFSFNPAFAAQIRSDYTKINFNDCLLLNADDFGARFACPGYKGFPLYIAEGDLRFFVSYGFNALNEKAASQTLPPFNRLNDTIEWRLEFNKETGNYFPFATILRWFTQTEDFENEKIIESDILVVTKIESGNTCHIAYIDVSLIKNANEIARSFADEEAKNFNCQNDDIFKIPD